MPSPPPCTLTLILRRREAELPNMRLKLTARGGRLIGKGCFLMAAAAGRSLSAIR
jgi:hypothetical protein